MGDKTAFFYGTLMAPGVLHRVIFGTSMPQEHQKTQIKILPAVLHGYERHKVRLADYPGIIKSEGASVKGTYVTGLTTMDIIRLDTFEGSDYDRVDVRVNVLKHVVSDEAQSGKISQEVDREEWTEAYVFKHRDELEEGEWDFDAFTRDRLSAWTLEDLDDFHDLEKDDGSDGTRGRGIGGAITAQLDADLEKK